MVSGPTGEQGPAGPGFVNGGMLARRDAAASAPAVVDAESIDVALERVAELGGSTVVGRRPVGDMGFTAYVRDPEGNVIGLWETASA